MLNGFLELLQTNCSLNSPIKGLFQNAENGQIGNWQITRDILITIIRAQRQDFPQGFNNFILYQDIARLFYWSIALRLLSYLMNLGFSVDTSFRIYLSEQFQLFTPNVFHVTCTQPIGNKDDGAAMLENMFLCLIDL